MARQIVCDRCKEVISGENDIITSLDVDTRTSEYSKERVNSSYELCRACSNVFFKAMEMPNPQPASRNHEREFADKIVATLEDNVIDDRAKLLDIRNQCQHVVGRAVNINVPISAYKVTAPLEPHVVVSENPKHKK